MTVITCLMIGKDRHISHVKVDAKKDNFTHNKGLYTIPKEAVNLTEFEGVKRDSYPELIYVEGTALPVNITKGSVSDFLERTVLSNALRQVARAQSDWLAIIKDYARNPSKLIILVFIGVIVVALIGAFLG